VINFEKVGLQLGHQHWFEKLEKICGNFEIKCLSGVSVRCFFFLRWKYHPKFGFPGETNVIAVKPITPSFDPLKESSSVAASMQVLAILQDQERRRIHFVCRP
jgi:hypothetical protein